MKKLVLLPMLATLLMSISASTASATPMTLTLLDTTLGSICNPGVNCVVITDNGSGDATAIANVMSVNAITVGSFTVAAQAMSSPLALGDPLDLYLSSFTVTANGSGVSTFQMTLSNSGLTSVALSGSTGMAKVTSAITVGQGTAPTAPSVSYLGSVNTNAVQVGTNAAQLTNSGTFSLTSSLDLSTVAMFNFYGAGSYVQGASKLAVVNAVATPEPSSIVLFGLGLMCLGMFARRRGQNGIYRQFVERGLVMKRPVFLPALVALALLSFGASPARASTLLSLALSDNAGHSQTYDDCLGACLDTTVDTDGTADHITFFGSIGAFDIQLETGYILDPTTSPQLNLLESFVSYTGPTGLCSVVDAGAGCPVKGLPVAGSVFYATLTRTGLDLSSLGSNWQANSTGVDAVTPTAAIHYSSQIIPDLGSPIDLGNASTSVNLPGTFSLVTTIQMTFVTAGSAGANSIVNVTGPVSTPEPGTMVLFGSALGVFGLASFGFGRSKKHLASNA